MPPRYAQILSTGRYVPETVLPNAYFDRLLNRPVDDWLVQNVGIRERHVMAAGETTSDLALHASRQALERAGLRPADLHLIIVATDTPDYLSPATAIVLQHKLGAVNAGTFDVNSACAGWVTAVDTAARYVITDPDVQRVLVVGAYGMSRFVDYTDHYTCTLFADGAGAVVVAAGNSPGFLAGKLIADGQYYDALGIYDGGATAPLWPAAAVTEEQGSRGAEEQGSGEDMPPRAPAPLPPRASWPHVQFVKKFPASFNADNWPGLVRSVVAKAGLTLDDVDLFLFTQLNVNTIKQTMATLGQPLAKTHWIMDKWGYTGSACLPMALDDALEHGRPLRPGDKVLFCASGGGIAMACGLWQWV